jgi:hypothetical protein
MSLLTHLLLAANPYNIPGNEIGLPNPTGSVGGGLQSILAIVMGVVGGLSVIFLIAGGLIMVISAGNPARFAKGRETVLYAIVGLVVAIAAYAIVFFIAGATKGGH